MRIQIRNPEWCNPDRRKDPVKLYNVPANEKELEALRLEWSYLRGRADIMWRRTLEESRTELRLLQKAGSEGPRGFTCLFGPGHVALRTGGLST